MTGKRHGDECNCIRCQIDAVEFGDTPPPIGEVEPLSDSDPYFFGEEEGTDPDLKP